MGKQTESYLATVAFFLILLCTTLTVHSADSHPACAQDLIVEARLAKLVAPYAPRPGGYCDGEAPSLHSGYLTLQSLTDGTIQFGPTHMEVFSAAKGKYWLRGKDLRPGGAYRLDGPLPGGRLKVDLGAAISRLKLPPDKLGLYAFKHDGIQDVYAPVSTGRSGVITAVFRYPGRIASVPSATLCQSSDPTCRSRADSFLEHHRSGATLITLHLPRVETSGRYRLTIKAKLTRPRLVPGLIFLDL